MSSPFNPWRSDFISVMSQIQELLQPAFAAIREHVNSDPDFQASAAGVRCTFAITSSENPQASIIVGIEHQRAALDIGPSHAGTFAIQARPEDWAAFFAKNLVRPYQSFWGILRVSSATYNPSLRHDDDYERILRQVLTILCAGAGLGPQ